MKRRLLEILIIITGLCILATVGGLMWAECKISEKI